ncbi:hypothetical protein F5B20DRAFT_441767 [Whalleya microplaca]|nr:hypothetical protein F5B20DRAFT_441767 [Whalleya microplaca]
MPGRGTIPPPLSFSDSASTRRPGSFDSGYSDNKSLSRSSDKSSFDDYRNDYHKKSGDRSSITGKSTRSSSLPSSSAPPSSAQSSSKPNTPTVNVYTHCGRHTDQYLLGGWSNLIKSTFQSRKE